MSGVDELASVHAFDGDEVLSALLVSVLVSENNLGKGGAAASVVDNVPHYALDVSAEDRLGTMQSTRYSGLGTPMRCDHAVLTPFSR